MSTSLPTPIVDSKIHLPDSSINNFLNYFGARKFGKTKGYTAEWVAQRIQKENPDMAISILKDWSHWSQKYDKDKVKELNMLTDKEVV